MPARYIAGYQARGSTDSSTPIEGAAFATGPRRTERSNKKKGPAQSSIMRTMVYSISALDPNGPRFPQDSTDQKVPLESASHPGLLLVTNETLTLAPSPPCPPPGCAVLGDSQHEVYYISELGKREELVPTPGTNFSAARHWRPLSHRFAGICSTAVELQKGRKAGSSPAYANAGGE